MNHIVYSGKSKDLLYRTDDWYAMRFKDHMKAADGRSFAMAGKGQILADISDKIFQYLTAMNVPNHHIFRADRDVLIVKKVTMFPFEFVIRRYAEGSYLKRNSAVVRYTRFEELIFEIFYKDDLLRDPVVVIDNDRCFLYRQDSPIGENSFLKTIDMPRKEYIETIRDISLAVFEALENKFAKKGGVLCDLKVEFGLHKTGAVILADSIEPDCWRLWLGDPVRNLDRSDGYGKEFTEEVQRSITEKYIAAQSFIQSVF